MLVVGVHVAVPAPILQVSVEKLLANPVEPACGSVTAIEDALLVVTYLFLSVATTG